MSIMKRIIDQQTILLKHIPSAKRRVPVPVGPRIPRRDVGTEIERHHELMLILFKPWSTVNDLKVASLSWVDAFEQWVPT